MVCKPCERRRQALKKALSEGDVTETAKQATIGLLEITNLIKKKDEP